MSTFAAAETILHEAVAARVFPAAAIEVGTATGPLWQMSCGRLTYDPDAPETVSETVFDLASLTKVIATTTLAMRLVDAGRLDLDDHVVSRLPLWRGPDREKVTVADLLSHASGLTSHLPFFRDHSGRAEFERAICTLPLEYAPRVQAIYSDLGFILLGFILADASGEALPDAFAALAREWAIDDLTFNPPAGWRRRTAPTQVETWRGRLLRGEVHDPNAWALGGAAGHAGLFGAVGAVARFAQAVLRTFDGASVIGRPDTLARFVQRSGVPGSSRALGWDTMLPTSSCGRQMSSRAIGHTGFTGTSLWIDPLPGIYVVLLTNRVYPTSANEAILAIRPRVHDAIMDVLRRSRP